MIRKDVKKRVSRQKVLVASLMLSIAITMPAPFWCWQIRSVPHLIIRQQFLPAVAEKGEILVYLEVQYRK